MRDTEEAVIGPSLNADGPHHLNPRTVEQAAYDQGATARYSGTAFWHNPHRRDGGNPDPIMAAMWNQGWLERDKAIRATLMKKSTTENVTYISQRR